MTDFEIKKGISLPVGSGGSPFQDGVTPNGVGPNDVGTKSAGDNNTNILDCFDDPQNCLTPTQKKLLGALSEYALKHPLFSSDKKSDKNVAARSLQDMAMSADIDSGRALVEAMYSAVSDWDSPLAEKFARRLFGLKEELDSGLGDVFNLFVEIAVLRQLIAMARELHAMPPQVKVSEFGRQIENEIADFLNVREFDERTAERFYGLEERITILQEYVSYEDGTRKSLVEMFKPFYPPQLPNSRYDFEYTRKNRYRDAYNYRQLNQLTICRAYRRVKIRWLKRLAELRTEGEKLQKMLALYEGKAPEAAGDLKLTESFQIQRDIVWKQIQAVEQEQKSIYKNIEVLSRTLELIRSEGYKEDNLLENPLILTKGESANLAKFIGVREWVNDRIEFLGSAEFKGALKILFNGVKEVEAEEAPYHQMDYGARLRLDIERTKQFLRELQMVKQAYFMPEAVVGLVNGIVGTNVLETSALKNISAEEERELRALLIEELTLYKRRLGQYRTRSKVESDGANVAREVIEVANRSYDQGGNLYIGDLSSEDYAKTAEEAFKAGGECLDGTKLGPEILKKLEDGPVDLKDVLNPDRSMRRKERDYFGIGSLENSNLDPFSIVSIEETVDGIIKYLEGGGEVSLELIGGIERLASGDIIAQLYELSYIGRCDGSIHDKIDELGTLYRDNVTIDDWLEKIYGKEVDGKRVGGILEEIDKEVLKTSIEEALAQVETYLSQVDQLLHNVPLMKDITVYEREELRKDLETLRANYGKALKLLDEGKYEEAQIEYLLTVQSYHQQVVFELFGEYMSNVQRTQAVKFAITVGIVVASGFLSSTAAVMLLAGRGGLAAELSLESLFFMMSSKGLHTALLKERFVDLDQGLLRASQDLALEYVETVAMFGALRGAAVLYGKTAGRSFFELAEERLINMGKIKPGQALKDLAIRAMVVKEMERGLAGLISKVGAFGNEYVGFTAFDFMKLAVYATAGVEGANPMDALTPEACLERLKFLLCLKLAGVLSSPITKPMRKKANELLLKKYSPEIDDLSERVEDVAKRLEAYGKKAKEERDPEELGRILIEGKELLAKRQALLERLVRIGMSTPEILANTNGALREASTSPRLTELLNKLVEMVDTVDAHTWEFSPDQRIEIYSMLTEFAQGDPKKFQRRESGIYVIDLGNGETLIIRQKAVDTPSPHVGEGRLPADGLVPARRSSSGGAGGEGKPATSAEPVIPTGSVILSGSEGSSAVKGPATKSGMPDSALDPGSLHRLDMPKVGGHARSGMTKNEPGMTKSEPGGKTTTGVRPEIAEKILRFKSLVNERGRSEDSTLLDALMKEDLTRDEAYELARVIRKRLMIGMIGKDEFRAAIAVRYYATLAEKFERGSPEVYEGIKAIRQLMKINWQWRPLVIGGYGKLLEKFKENDAQFIAESKALRDLMTAWETETPAIEAYGKLLPYLQDGTTEIYKTAEELFSVIETSGSDWNVEAAKKLYFMVLDKFEKESREVYREAKKLRDRMRSGHGNNMRTRMIAAEGYGRLLGKFGEDYPEKYKGIMDIRELMMVSVGAGRWELVRAYVRAIEGLKEGDKFVYSEARKLRGLIEFDGGRGPVDLNSGGIDPVRKTILETYNGLFRRFKLDDPETMSELGELMKLFLAGYQGIEEIFLSNFYAIRQTGFLRGMFDGEFGSALKLSPEALNSLQKLVKDKNVEGSYNAWREIFRYLANCDADKKAILEGILTGGGKARKKIRALMFVNNVAEEDRPDIYKKIKESMTVWKDKQAEDESAPVVATRIVNLIVMEMIGRLTEKGIGSAANPLFAKDRPQGLSEARWEEIQRIKETLYENGTFSLLISAASFMGQTGRNSLDRLMDMFAEGRVEGGRVIVPERYKALGEYFDKAFVERWAKEYHVEIETKTGAGIDPEGNIAEIVKMAGNQIDNHIGNVRATDGDVPAAVHQLLTELKRGVVETGKVERLLTIFEQSYREIAGKYGVGFADIRADLRALLKGLTGMLKTSEKASVEITGSGDGMIKSGTEPVETCQTLRTETDYNQDGQPINLVFHGQVKVANYKVNGVIAANMMLEVTRDKDGNVYLFADRLYTSGEYLVDVAAFREAICQYAESLGISRARVFFDGDPGVREGTVAPLLIEYGRIYRDTHFRLPIVEGKPPVAKEPASKAEPVILSGSEESSAEPVISGPARPRQGTGTAPSVGRDPESSAVKGANDLITAKEYSKALGVCKYLISGDMTRDEIYEVARVLRTLMGEGDYFTRREAAAAYMELIPWFEVGSRETYLEGAALRTLMESGNEGTKQVVANTYKALAPRFEVGSKEAYLGGAALRSLMESGDDNTSRAAVGAYKALAPRFEVGSKEVYFEGAALRSLMESGNEDTKQVVANTYTALAPRFEVGSKEVYLGGAALRSLMESGDRFTKLAAALAYEALAPRLEVGSEEVYLGGAALRSLMENADTRWAAADAYMALAPRFEVGSKEVYLGGAALRSLMENASTRRAAARAYKALAPRFEVGSKEVYLGSAALRLLMKNADIRRVAVDAYRALAPRLGGGNRDGARVEFFSLLELLKYPDIREEIIQILQTNFRLFKGHDLWREAFDGKWAGSLGLSKDIIDKLKAFSTTSYVVDSGKGWMVLLTYLLDMSPAKIEILEKILTSGGKARKIISALRGMNNIPEVLKEKIYSKVIDSIPVWEKESRGEKNAPVIASRVSELVKRELFEFLREKVGGNGENLIFLDEKPKDMKGEDWRRLQEVKKELDENGTLGLLVSAASFMNEDGLESVERLVRMLNGARLEDGRIVLPERYAELGEIFDKGFVEAWAREYSVKVKAAGGGSPDKDAQQKNIIGTQRAQIEEHSSGVDLTGGDVPRMVASLLERLKTGDPSAVEVDRLFDVFESRYQEIADEYGVVFANIRDDLRVLRNGLRGELRVGRDAVVEISGSVDAIAKSGSEPVDTCQRLTSLHSEDTNANGQPINRILHGQFKQALYVVDGVTAASHDVEVTKGRDGRAYLLVDKLYLSGTHLVDVEAFREAIYRYAEQELGIERKRVIFSEDVGGGGDGKVEIKPLATGDPIYRDSWKEEIDPKSLPAHKGDKPGMTGADRPPVAKEPVRPPRTPASKNTEVIKSEALVADLASGVTVEDRVLSDAEFDAVKTRILGELAERDKVWRNSYHNSPHGIDVFERVTLFADLLGIKGKKKQMLQFAALLHDYDHNGKTLRGDKSGLSNEEVAAIAADRIAKELGFSPRQREIIYGLIIGTTCGNSAIEPATGLEMVLALADIAGFMKPFDAWVKEGMGFLGELLEQQRPATVEAWVKFELAFLDKFVKPRINDKKTPEPLRRKLMEDFDRTRKQVEDVEKTPELREMIERELAALHPSLRASAEPVIPGSDPESSAKGPAADDFIERPMSDGRGGRGVKIKLEKVDGLIAVAKYSDALVICQKLVKKVSGPNDAYEVGARLRRLMQDGDTRWEAVDAYGALAPRFEVGSKEAYHEGEALRALMRYFDPGIRWAAVGAYRALAPRFEVGSKEVYLGGAALRDLMRDNDIGIRRTAVDAYGALAPRFEVGSEEAYLGGAALRSLMRDINTRWGAVDAYRALAPRFEVGSEEAYLGGAALRSLMRDFNAGWVAADVYRVLVPRFGTENRDGAKEELFGLLVLLECFEIREDIISILRANFRLFKANGLWGEVFESDWAQRLPLSKDVKDRLKGLSTDPYVRDSVNCWMTLLTYLLRLSPAKVEVLDNILVAGGKARKIISALKAVNNIPYELRDGIEQKIVNSIPAWKTEIAGQKDAPTIAVRVVELVRYELFSYLREKVGGNGENWVFLEKRPEKVSRKDWDRLQEVKKALEDNGVLGLLASAASFMNEDGVKSIGRLVRMLNSARVENGRVILPARYGELSEIFDKAFVEKWVKEYSAAIEMDKSSLDEASQRANIIRMATSQIETHYRAGENLDGGDVPQKVAVFLKDLKEGNVSSQKADELFNEFESKYQEIKERYGMTFANIRDDLRVLRNGLRGGLKVGKGAIVEISGSVDLIAKSGTEPVDTCQGLTSLHSSETNGNGQPINRILHGQFKQAVYVVDGVTAASYDVEVTKGKDGKAYLLVDRLYISGAYYVDVEVFREVIYRYAEKELGIERRRVIFSEDVGGGGDGKVGVRPLATGDEIYRDSWGEEISPDDLPAHVGEEITPNPATIGTLDSGSRSGMTKSGSGMTGTAGVTNPATMTEVGRRLFDTTSSGGAVEAEEVGEATRAFKERLDGAKDIFEFIALFAEPVDGKSIWEVESADDLRPRSWGGYRFKNATGIAMNLIWLVSGRGRSSLNLPFELNIIGRGQELWEKHAQIFDPAIGYISERAEPSKKKERYSELEEKKARLYELASELGKKGERKDGAPIVDENNVISLTFVLDGRRPLKSLPPELQKETKKYMELVVKTVLIRGDAAPYTEEYLSYEGVSNLEARYRAARAQMEKEGTLTPLQSPLAYGYEKIFVIYNIAKKILGNENIDTYYDAQSAIREAVEKDPEGFAKKVKGLSQTEKALIVYAYFGEFNYRPVSSKKDGYAIIRGLVRLGVDFEMNIADMQTAGGRAYYLYLGGARGTTTLRKNGTRSRVHTHSSRPDYFDGHYEFSVRQSITDISNSMRRAIRDKETGEDDGWVLAEVDGRDGMSRATVRYDKNRKKMRILVEWSVTGRENSKKMEEYKRAVSDYYSNRAVNDYGSTNIREMLMEEWVKAGESIHTFPAEIEFEMRFVSYDELDRRYNKEAASEEPLDPARPEPIEGQAGSAAMTDSALDSSLPLRMTDAAGTTDADRPPVAKAPADLRDDNTPKPRLERPYEEGTTILRNKISNKSAIGDLGEELRKITDEDWVDLVWLLRRRNPEVERANKILAGYGLEIKSRKAGNNFALNKINGHVVIDFGIKTDEQTARRLTQIISDNFARPADAINKELAAAEAKGKEFGDRERRGFLLTYWQGQAGALFAKNRVISNASKIELAADDMSFILSVLEGVSEGPLSPREFFGSLKGSHQKEFGRVLRKIDKLMGTRHAEHPAWAGLIEKQPTAEEFVGRKDLTEVDTYESDDIRPLYTEVIADKNPKEEYTWGMQLDGKGEEIGDVVRKGGENRGGTPAEDEYSFVHSHHAGRVRDTEVVEYEVDTTGWSIAPSPDDIIVIEKMVKRHFARHPGATKTAFRRGDIYYHYIVSSEGILRITYNVGSKLSRSVLAPKFRVEFAGRPGSTFDSAATRQAILESLGQRNPRYLDEYQGLVREVPYEELVRLDVPREAGAWAEEVKAPRSTEAGDLPDAPRLYGQSSFSKEEWETILFTERALPSLGGDLGTDLCPGKTVSGITIGGKEYYFVEYKDGSVSLVPADAVGPAGRQSAKTTRLQGANDLIAAKDYSKALGVCENLISGDMARDEAYLVGGVLRLLMESGDGVTKRAAVRAYGALAPRFEVGSREVHLEGAALRSLMESGNSDTELAAADAYGALAPRFEVGSREVYLGGAALRLLMESGDSDTELAAADAYRALVPRFEVGSREVYLGGAALRLLMESVDADIKWLAFETYEALAPRFGGENRDGARVEFFGLMELLKDPDIRGEIIQILQTNFRLFKGHDLWREAFDSKWAGRLGLSKDIIDKLKAFSTDPYVIDSVNSWVTLITYLSNLSPAKENILDKILTSGGKARKIVSVLRALNNIPEVLEEKIHSKIIDSIPVWEKESKGQKNAPVIASHVAELVKSELFEFLCEKVGGNGENLIFLDERPKDMKEEDWKRLQAVKKELDENGTLGLLVSAAAFMNEDGLESVGRLIRMLNTARMENGRIVVPERYVELGKIFDKEFVEAWVREYLVKVEAAEGGSLDKDAQLKNIIGAQRSQLEKHSSGVDLTRGDVPRMVASLLERLKTGDPSAVEVDRLFDVFESRYQEIADKYGMIFANIRDDLRVLRNGLRGELRVGGDAVVEISGSVDAIAKSGSEPVDTCQRLTSLHSGDTNADGEPINRILHGQFKQALYIVDGVTVASHDVEVTKGRDGKAYLLVDLLYISGTHFVDVKAFRGAIYRYAEEVLGIDRARVIFSEKIDIDVDGDRKVDIKPLATGDRVYRDSWKEEISPGGLPAHVGDKPGMINSAGKVDVARLDVDELKAVKKGDLAQVYQQLFVENGRMKKPDYAEFKRLFNEGKYAEFFETVYRYAMELFGPYLEISDAAARQEDISARLGPVEDLAMEMSAIDWFITCVERTPWLKMALETIPGFDGMLARVKGSFDPIARVVQGGSEVDLPEINGWLSELGQNADAPERLKELFARYDEILEKVKGAQKNLQAAQPLVNRKNINHKTKEKYWSLRDKLHYLRNRMTITRSVLDGTAPAKKLQEYVPLEKLNPFAFFPFVLQGLGGWKLSAAAREYFSSLGDVLSPEKAGDIYRVIMNMINNAERERENLTGREFEGEIDVWIPGNGPLPEGMSEEVRANPEKFIVVYVKDNGPGIPPEVEARLRSGERVHGDPSKPGDGEGLMNARNIVRGLGGDIGFETGPGKGATFFIALPKGSEKGPSAGPAGGTPFGVTGLFTTETSVYFLRHVFPKDVRATIDPVVELTKMIETGDVEGAAEKIHKYFINITDALRSIKGSEDVTYLKDMAVVRLEEKAAAFDAFSKFLEMPENARLREALMAREKFAEQFASAKEGLKKYHEVEAAAQSVDSGDRLAESGRVFVGEGELTEPDDLLVKGLISPSRYELRKQYEAEFGKASTNELICYVEEVVEDTFGVGIRRNFLALKGKETLIGLAAELRLAAEAKKNGEAPEITPYVAEVLNKGLPPGVKIMPDGSLERPTGQEMKKEIAQFLARLGITGEEMDPVLERVPEKTIERIWFTYMEQTGDGGRFVAVSDGLKEVGYEIKITTVESAEGPVREFRLASVDEPAGVIDAVAISRGDKAALREGLRTGFRAKNSYNIDDTQVGTLFPPENFERLDSTLKILGAYLERGGKRPGDVTVCVAGHGSYDVYTILFLLRRGYRVVSRETTDVQYLMVRKFQEEAKEKYGVDLEAAKASGRLVLSGYERRGHPTKYDMIVWSHPQVVAGDVGVLLRKTLTENLRDGGILVVQSDAPEFYVDPFEKDSEFERLFTADVYKNDSLLFSANMPERGDKSGPTPKVGIFEKRPTEGDKSPPAGPGPIGPTTPAVTGGEAAAEGQTTEEKLRAILESDETSNRHVFARYVFQNVPPDHPILDALVTKNFVDGKAYTVLYIVCAHRLIAYARDTGRKGIADRIFKVFRNHDSVNPFKVAKSVELTEDVKGFLGEVVNSHSDPMVRFYALSIAEAFYRIYNDGDMLDLVLAGLNDENTFVVAQAANILDRVAPDVAAAATRHELAQNSVRPGKSPEFGLEKYVWGRAEEKEERDNLLLMALNKAERPVNKEVALKDIRPIHSLVDYSPNPVERRPKFAEKCNELRKLIEKYGTKNRDEILRQFFVEEGGDWGRAKALHLPVSDRLYLVQGHHRVAALFKLAEEGVVPREWLEHIPVQVYEYNLDRSEALARRILTLGVDLEWEDLFPPVIPFNTEP